MTCVPHAIWRKTNRFVDPHFFLYVINGEDTVHRTVYTPRVPVFHLSHHPGRFFYTLRKTHTLLFLFRSFAPFQLCAYVG